jgi:adenylate kinase
MGGPGAGKGTQAKRLEQTLGLPQIATGDLFREHLRKETELGKVARQYMDAGELVPDEVTVAMAEERIARPDCAGGAVFDGFPRTLPQVQALDDLLAQLGARVNIVPYIHVSREVLLARLAGRWTCSVCGRVYHVLFSPPQTAGICDRDGGELYQRADDTVETQRHRIEVYFKQTAPLVETYRQRDLLVEIDGEQPIDDVHCDLVAAIRQVLN